MNDKPHRFGILEEQLIQSCQTNNYNFGKYKSPPRAVTVYYCYLCSVMSKQLFEKQIFDYLKLYRAHFTIIKDCACVPYIHDDKSHVFSIQNQEYLLRMLKVAYILVRKPSTMSVRLGLAFQFKKVIQHIYHFEYYNSEF